jgi:Integrase core domain
VSWFGNPLEARGKVGGWRKEYNEERPHSSLGHRTPVEFAAAVSGGGSSGKAAPWKSLNPGFSPALGNSATAAGFPLSHHSGDGGLAAAGELTGPDVV